MPHFVYADDCVSLLNSLEEFWCAPGPYELAFRIRVSTDGSNGKVAQDKRDHGMEAPCISLSRNNEKGPTLFFIFFFNTDTAKNSQTFCVYQNVS